MPREMPRLIGLASEDVEGGEAPAGGGVVGAVADEGEGAVEAVAGGVAEPNGADEAGVGALFLTAAAESQGEAEAGGKELGEFGDEVGGGFRDRVACERRGLRGIRGGVSVEGGEGDGGLGRGEGFADGGEGGGGVGGRSGL